MKSAIFYRLSKNPKNFPSFWLCQ